LRALERELPAAPPPERDELLRQIEAGEELLDELAQRARGKLRVAS
jgi:hypothetical protein